MRAVPCIFARDFGKSDSMGFPVRGVFHSRPGHSQPQVVVDGDGNLLLGAEVTFGRLDGGVTEQELDLFEVSTVLAAEFRAGAAQVVSAKTLDSDGFRGGSTTLHTAQSLSSSPTTRPLLETGRSSRPALWPAAAVQESIRSLTHIGMATVRMRPPLPRRSAITQRPSRC